MKTIALSFLLMIFSLCSAFGQTRQDSLIVFIGEKISVTYTPTEYPVDTIIKGKDTTYRKQFPVIMDNKYIAKYKILQLVHGTYQQDTIRFTVFDHYGIPAFSKCPTVLLFLSYYNGELYHEKYQYFDLYMTSGGRWASPYPAGDYNHPYKDSITVKPEKIPFAKEVSFPLNGLTSKQVETMYPAPYYEIKDGKALAIYGNYADDLFKLKQQTILKARGIY